MKRKGNLLLKKIHLSIFVLVFVLYGNSLKNGFAIDDRYVTVTNMQRPDNPRVAKGIRGIPEIFTSHYVESDSHSFDYRPVPLASFAIEYQFFKGNAHVSHFINVLIYAFTCVLLFLVLTRLLPAYSLFFPLLVTLLFLVHPVHTEVVNNIKCRDELLAFFFGSLAVYFFLQLEAVPKRAPVIFKVVLFLLLALLCKKTAVLFIGLILLVAWFFRERELKKMTFVAILLFSAFALYFGLQKWMLGNVAETRDFTFYENPLYFEHGILPRMQAALFSSGYYLRLLLVPYPLCFYYGYNAVSLEGWGMALIVFSLVTNGALVFYAMKKMKQRHVLSFGILVYLMGLFPFINLIFPVVGIFGERFIYFSSFGFCIMAAYSLMKFTKMEIVKGRQDPGQINSSMKAAVIVIGVIFSVMIVARNAKWKDLMTLSLVDEKHFGNSYMIQAFVANNLYAQMMGLPPGFKKRAMAEDAKKHFERSAQILQEGLKVYEADLVSMNTLGSIYCNYLGRTDEAIALFKRVLEKKPAYEAAQYNLVHCYEMKNLPDTAILLYEKMLDRGSANAQVYLRLHDLYMGKKQFAKAFVSDKIGLEKNPGDVQMLVNLGNDCMMNSDTVGGLRYFEEAAAQAPNDVDLLLRVSEVFSAAGMMQKSNEYRLKALNVKKQAR